MTAYIELREVVMNFDANMLMTMMSLLNRKPENGAGANNLQALLPLLMSMTGGRTAETASANAGGGNDMMKMLPLIMGLMSGNRGVGGTDGQSTYAASQPPNGNAYEENRNPSYTGGYGAEHTGANYAGTGAGYAGAYAQSRPDPYRNAAHPQNAPYNRPFGDIGFAGNEVRGFMEKLWRIRRRI